MSVLDEIAAERRRQIEAEGWTPEHDDTHSSGALSAAAACYAVGFKIKADDWGPVWPWDEKWWKPKDPRRNLVRAAALLVAEIERWDRASLGAELQSAVRSRREPPMRRNRLRTQSS